MRSTIQRAVSHVWMTCRKHPYGMTFGPAVVAALVELPTTHASVRRELQIAFILVSIIIPLALATAALIAVAVTALTYWARTPKRRVVLRTIGVIVACLLAIYLGTIAMQRMPGPYLTVWLMLFVGINGTALMFTDTLIARWEARGFLRQLKAKSGLQQPAGEP